MRRSNCGWRRRDRARARFRFRPRAGVRRRHVAIIMDGNRRWARSRNLTHLEGHRAGADVLGAIVRAAAPRRNRIPHGLRILGRELAARSRRNRRADGLAARLLRREAPALAAEGVRFRLIGRIGGCPTLRVSRSKRSRRRPLQTAASRSTWPSIRRAHGALRCGPRAARDVAAGKLGATAVDGDALASNL